MSNLSTNAGSTRREFSQPHLEKPRNVVVLGSTGSIGTNCLDVIEHLPERLAALGLSAHTSREQLVEQARRHKPRWVTVTDGTAADGIRRGDLPAETELLIGTAGIVKMVTDPDTNIVLTAIVGAAGLEGTWAALEAGKTVAVANKETLVMAGPLVMELARQRGTRLLPVDSEHSAIFQAMQGSRHRRRGPRRLDRQRRSFSRLDGCRAGRCDRARRGAASTWPWARKSRLIPPR